MTSRKTINIDAQNESKEEYAMMITNMNRKDTLRRSQSREYGVGTISELYKHKNFQHHKLLAILFLSFQDIAYSTNILTNERKTYPR